MHQNRLVLISIDLVECHVGDVDLDVLRTYAAIVSTTCNQQKQAKAAGTEILLSHYPHRTPWQQRKGGLVPWHVDHLLFAYEIFSTDHLAYLVTFYQSIFFICSQLKFYCLLSVYDNLWASSFYYLSHYLLKLLSCVVELDPARSSSLVTQCLLVKTF